MSWKVPAILYYARRNLNAKYNLVSECPRGCGSGGGAGGAAAPLSSFPFPSLFPSFFPC